MVLNQHNWDRIAEMCDLVTQLGANHLVCNRLIGPETGLSPSEAQLRAAMAAVELSRSQGLPVRFGNCIPQCFEPSSSRGCTAGTTFATIDPWGRMRPCNHSPLIAGDVRAVPIERVWHGDVMARWRALVPQACTGCAAFAACHGGCRAQGILVEKRQDPLITTLPTGYRTALLSTPVRPELRLFEQLCPTGTFALQSQEGADFLLSKSAVIPVPPGCASLAMRLDGSLNLRQIERQYGNGALDWVGLLYQEGLVTWASA
jgi:radical SAM protein with 4Fe4S-binding SPASM domain